MSEYNYAFPMAAVTSTMIVIGYVIDQTDSNKVETTILLGRRGDTTDAFSGQWCLPGGFLDVGTETTLECASRELKEECGLTVDTKDWTLVCCDDNPHGTDQRYIQIVNLCYYANKDAVKDWDVLAAADDIQEVKIFTLAEIRKMKLAFNHNNIVEKTISYLID